MRLSGWRFECVRQVLGKQNTRSGSQRNLAQGWNRVYVRILVGVWEIGFVANRDYAEYSVAIGGVVQRN